MDAQRKPTVPEVLPRFRAYGARCAGLWGSLHIALEDLNLDDSSVAWCKKHAIESGDTEGAELADLLLRMSQTQRYKIAYRA